MQPGGTAIMAFGRLAGLVIDTGKDPTGLGRYCWIEIGNADTSPFEYDFNTAFLLPEWNQLYVEAIDTAGNSTGKAKRIIMYRSQFLNYYLPLITQPLE